jgi:hypothetical protein
MTIIQKQIGAKYLLHAIQTEVLHPYSLLTANKITLILWIEFFLDIVHCQKKIIKIHNNVCFETWLCLPLQAR